MRKLPTGISNYEDLEKIVAGEYIESELTEKFNSEITFGEKELISLLYYLGYLTIADKGYSKCTKPLNCSYTAKKLPKPLDTTT